jgi:hypothetical protein
MGRKMEDLIAWIIISVGWVIFLPAVTQSAEEEKGIPQIVQSFATKELRPGDVWKVYLKASDPEGKMKYITATISQPGVGSYPVSMTKIKEENEKELSGYVYLNTDPIRLARFFNLTLTLTVNIKDDKGKFSKPAVFPLSFVGKPAPEAPPEGIFKEQDLGPIMVTLRTDDGGRRRR